MDRAAQPTDRGCRCAGFSSPYATRGERFATRLTVPGEYRIYCSLHPVQMSQVVRVRPPGT